MSKKKPKDDFDLGIDFEVLKSIYDHLKTEHGLPDSCETIETLVSLWGEAANNRVARNPDDTNDAYTTYRKVVVTKR